MALLLFWAAFSYYKSIFMLKKRHAVFSIILQHLSIAGRAISLPQIGRYVLLYNNYRFN